nr:chemotaxis protein CheW [uncultured Dethiosulfovibrio sp.]
MTAKKSCVEFVLDEKHFALPLENVKEIISRPEITPLPMASKHVRGIINLRGDVIPVVDLAVRLGGTEERKDRSEILILVIDGLTAGVMVDSASQVAELDTGDLRELDSNAVLDRSAVRGVVRHGERLVIFLNAQSILSVDREIISQIARGKEEDRRDRSSLDIMRIVTFDLGGDTYGFRLEEVREILRYQEPVSIPDSPPFVEGVLQVRGAILPVVNLRERLRRPGDMDPERAKILVADYGDFKIGFIADAIKEVLQVPLSEVSDPPAVVRGESGHQAVCAIVNHCDEIVTVLDKDGLVDRDRLRDIASDEDSDRKDESSVVGYETFVVFRVSEQPFGLPIKKIREINRVGNLSKVPGMPDFVEGVLDLRGEVIPAVSLRKRLGMGLDEPVSEDGRILVVEMSQGLLGLMVDDVTGVSEVPLSRISEPPLSMKELGKARDFVSKVARTESEGERMVLVLSPESLLSPEEAASAKDIAGV